MTDKSNDKVGHLNTILAIGGGNLNDPNYLQKFKCPGFARGMLKFRVDRRIMGPKGKEKVNHATSFKSKDSVCDACVLRINAIMIFLHFLHIFNSFKLTLKPSRRYSYILGPLFVIKGHLTSPKGTSWVH